MNKKIIIITIIFSLTLFLLLKQTLYKKEKIKSPLQSLSLIVKELGYDENKAKKIAEFLLPLHKKITFRNLVDQETLIQDLKINIDIIYENVFDENQIPYPEHFELYSLLVDEESAEFIKKVILNLDVGTLTEQQIEMIRLPFACSYLSVLGCILYRAKGLELQGIFTEDIGPIAEFDELEQGLTPAGSLTLRNTRIGHFTCLLRIKNKKYMFYDFTHGFTSKPFQLDSAYTQHRVNVFELSSEIGRSDLYKEFYLFNKRDYRSTLYDNAGTFYSLFGRKQKAIEYMQKAIELTPGNPQICFKLANYLVNVGRYQEAIPYLQKAIDLKPKFDLAYYALGFIYQDLKQFHLAIDYYKEAIKTNPYYAHAYSNLGTIFIELGEPETAFQYYKKAIEVAPNDPKMYYDCGLSYLILDRYVEGRKYIEKALELYRQLGDKDKVSDMQEVLRELSRM